jgi:hypothetical protein
MGTKKQKVTEDIIAAFRAEGASARMKVRHFRLPNGADGWIVDAGNGKPARKVQPGWQGRSTGSPDTKKATRPLHWESENERAALRICEYDPEVVEIRTQPYTVVHQADGKLTRTYPDIEVVMTDRRRKIIQVKVEKALTDPKVHARLERDRVAFEAFDWSYEIWTDTYVRKQPRHETLKTLHYYRRHQPPASDVDRVREYLGIHGPQPIRALRDLLGRNRPLESTLMPLIAQRVISIDFMQPFDEGAQAFLVH